MGSNAFANIPDELFSQDAIEYVGFSKQKAAEIWAGWVNWPPGPPREIDPHDACWPQVTFLDYIKGHANYTNDVWHDDDAAWFNCMQQKAIAIDLQQAIMDPIFKYMRMTGICITWVRNAIDMRYRGIENIQRGVILGMAIHSCSSSRAISAQSAPGLTILFEAVDTARTTRLFDTQGQLDKIMDLSSPPPTDFSRNKSMYYFTTSFAVAKRYAAWVKRSANCESVVIIKIAIRNKVIQSMSESNIQRLYWPSDDWKEFVWRCRTKKQPSTELRKYAIAALIIGTIANNTDKNYCGFESGSQLTEDAVLKVDGPRGQQNGIQFVFSTDEEGEDLLLEAASRTIETFSFTKDDMETWIREHDNQIDS
ncbi:hypothetical protein FLONG3_9839 [Fusarium longipes]|uniref:Uncharacterized protein n=1 Tax=Fusarium longipes TaxID=694270 RepID=A0A395RU03_9HYPO|nr:hypothetical protein FLONG3_9839 [Fusarium longipes]